MKQYQLNIKSISTQFQLNINSILTQYQLNHWRTQKPLLKKVGLNKQVINFALIRKSISQIKLLINFCFRSGAEKNIDHQNNDGGR